jgi:hypothetical protein
MRSGARSGEVSLNTTVGVTKLTSMGSGVARMTPVNVPERVNELRDGVIPRSTPRQRADRVHIGNPG